MDLIGIKMSQCAWLEKALRLFISLCLAVPQSVVRASNGADPICIQSLAESHNTQLTAQGKTCARILMKPSSTSQQFVDSMMKWLQKQFFFNLFLELLRY